jgi:hypothetical protein
VLRQSPVDVIVLVHELRFTLAIVLIRMKVVCERVRNRAIVWSANVGVPVEHCDSAAIETFREVLRVAWLWVRSGIPSDLCASLEAYRASLEVDDVTDCHAIPEISAAVQSFIISREALPGIYVYFDIGGGTVDGVAFDFINNDGDRRVNFYSGKVSPLGVAALLKMLGSDASSNFDSSALQRLMSARSGELLTNFGLEIQRLVAGVIMEAKRKDARDWQTDAIQSPYFERRRIGTLDPSQMRPLLIFIGGGGSRSKWYQSTINSTYSDFQHNRAGIPPYKLAAVPRPGDLDMRTVAEEEFCRFAIAYGCRSSAGKYRGWSSASASHEASLPDQGI